MPLRAFAPVLALGLLAGVVGVPGDVAAPDAPPGGVVGGFEEDVAEELAATAPDASPAGGPLPRPAVASPALVDALGLGTLAAVALAIVVLFVRGRRR
jgi:hypothetical protein